MSGCANGSLETRVTSPPKKRELEWLGRGESGHTRGGGDNDVYHGKVGPGSGNLLGGCEEAVLGR